MSSKTTSDLLLPAEAKAVVWRIFGAGRSSLTGPSTYDFIETMVPMHDSPSERDSAISEIRGWFEFQGSKRSLREDMREPVAGLILDGIGSNRSHTAVWAISSIDAELASKTVLSRWTQGEIDSFIEAAIATLENLCSRDQVVDATRCNRFGLQNFVYAKIPKDAIQREGRLETLRYLYNHGLELVREGLHRGAGNLIELVLKLQPERFEALIERLDHPVMQVRAASRMTVATMPQNHRYAVGWITAESCDALVALAIWHTLATVNKLDADRRFADRFDADHYVWNTELRPPCDDLDAAATSLVAGLVDRLALFEPLACARWVGELLSDAPLCAATE